MTKLYMSPAIADVKFNRLSLRKASKKYGVPKSTLDDHVTGKVPEGARWGKQPLFNAREETEMVQCAVEWVLFSANLTFLGLLEPWQSQKVCC